MSMIKPKKSAAKPKKATRITVSLTDGDHTALALIAERCNVSLSWVTRQAITEFLEHHNDANARLPLASKAKGKTRHV